MKLFLNSPMEQYEIYSVISFLNINNINLYLIIVMMICIILPFLHNNKLVPNWWGIFNESLYRTLLSMVINYIGPKMVIYLPLIYTIFHLILFSNLIGMIPYTSTPTVEIVMTLSLAFTVLIGTLIMGFFSHKLILFAVFLPAGTPMGLIFLMVPLEILAYLTRTLSLGLRLAVNLITGHILAKVLIGFIWSSYVNNISIIFLSAPLLLVALFLSLELLIAYLQAYIFTFITCITIKDIV
jgi:F-type H+-transporting ATPase subunit a